MGRARSTQPSNTWAQANRWRQLWASCVPARSSASSGFRNIGLRGGVAPARAYIPELLGDVLEGRINPERVFDFETDLDHVAEAYKAMNERRAIKSLVRIR
jgi:threonine dehydrogenase-like Zn-dependent dehydrogenase